MYYSDSDVNALTDTIALQIRWVIKYAHSHTHSKRYQINRDHPIQIQARHFRQSSFGVFEIYICEIVDFDDGGWTSNRTIARAKQEPSIRFYSCLSSCSLSMSFSFGNILDTIFFCFEYISFWFRFFFTFLSIFMHCALSADFNLTHPKLIYHMTLT